MSDEDIHTLSGAYALDAVDDGERARFEEHLASCDSCRTEVAELRTVAAALAELSDATPPPSLRDAVLADVAAVRPLPPPAGMPSRTARPDVASEGGSPAGSGAGRHARPEPPARRRFLVAAAAAVVLVGGGTLAVTRPWEETARPPSVAQQVERAPDAQRSSKRIGSATATVIRSESLDKAVLVTDGMAAVPSGKTYQAWLQAPDGSLASAGLLGGGSQTLVLQGSTADATGVGITVEPAGGSKQPTTEPLALIPLS